MDSDVSYRLLSLYSDLVQKDDDMNHANYKKLLQEKLVLNLDPNQLLCSTMNLTRMYSSTGTQPAVPGKSECCSGWISMLTVQLRHNKTELYGSHKNA